jgi:hypothetical protein
MDLKESTVLMDKWLEWKRKENIESLRLEDMPEI